MKRKEKRSLFSKIFGTKKPNETYGTQLEMLSGWGGSFKAFDGLKDEQKKFLMHFTRNIY